MVSLHLDMDVVVIQPARTEKHVEGLEEAVP